MMRLVGYVNHICFRISQLILERETADFFEAENPYKSRVLGCGSIIGYKIFVL
jgi:hypothetical protein